MMIVNNNQRIFWVDWAKSICMFLVVLGHCHIRESEQFVTQYIYSFHILLFFFLSGLLCKRHLNKESVLKDIRFLILPYFTYGLLIIAFNMLCSRLFDAEIIWHKIKALSIGLDAGIGPIWFLLALYICKQMFMIISLVKKYNMYLYYLIVFLSLFPIFFISSFHINLPFFSDSALCGLPFFIIGNESKSLMRDLMHINKFWQLVLAVLLGLVSIVLCKMNGFVAIADCIVGNSIILYYTNALLAIISVILFCRQLFNINLHFVRVTSYGSIVTLGLHGFFLTFLSYYVPSFLGFYSSTYSIHIALVYSIIVYIACYMIIIHVADKMPILFGVKGHCP